MGLIIKVIRLLMLFRLEQTFLGFRVPLKMGKQMELCSLFLRWIIFFYVILRALCVLCRYISGCLTLFIRRYAVCSFSFSCILAMLIRSIVQFTYFNLF